MLLMFICIVILQLVKQRLFGPRNEKLFKVNGKNTERLRSFYPAVKNAILIYAIYLLKALN